MKLLLKLIVGGFCLALSVSSHAYYFWDQGFNNPAVKTNYQSLSEGTYLNPITLVSPCLFSSGAFNGCPSNYQPPAPYQLWFGKQRLVAKHIMECTILLGVGK